MILICNMPGGILRCIFRGAAGFLAIVQGEEKKENGRTRTVEWHHYFCLKVYYGSLHHIVNSIARYIHACMYPLLNRQHRFIRVNTVIVYFFLSCGNY